MNNETIHQFALNVANAATNGRSMTNRKRAIQEVIAHKESNNSFVDIDNVTAHRNAITKISKQANVSSVVGDVKTLLVTNDSITSRYTLPGYCRARAVE